MLVELGADVQAQDVNGLSPMHWAAHNGHAETVRVLVELGADVQSQDVNGFSPMHHAAQSGHVETVRVLVELGADLSALLHNDLSVCG